LSSVVTFEARWKKDRFQYETLKIKGNLVGLRREVEKLQSEISRLSTPAKETTSAFGKMFSPDWITKGMALRIGWRAMYAAIDGVSKATNDLIMNNVKLEASLVSLEHIAGTTGRRFGEVMTIVNNQIGEFASRGAVTDATMRLMQTSLSTEQIEKLIERFKEGAIAFGYVADEQLPLLARGFIEHRKQILNNIGYQKDLNRVWKEAREELGILSGGLTTAQEDQALWNSVMEETASVMGITGAALDTASGQIKKLSSEWKKLSEQVGTAGGTAGFIKKVVGGWAWIAEDVRIGLEIKKIVKENADLQREFKTIMDTTRSAADKYNLSMGETESLLHDTRIAFLEYAKGVLNSEEFVRLGIEMDTGLNSLKIELDSTTQKVEKLTFTIEENKKSIKDSQHEVELERHELELLQRSLRAVNSELTEQTRLQNEAKRALEESQSKLISKQKVLDPEAFKETEDKLKDIQSELKRAVREEESAQKLLLKRVEPKLWIEYQERAKKAHEEVTRLTKKEANTKTMLVTEIESLLETVRNQQSEYDTLTSRVNDLTQRKMELNDQIEIGKDRVNDLNDEIFNWRNENYEAEKSIVALEEQIIELNDEILDGTNKLKDYYTAMYNLDSFQIRDKSYTVTEYQRVVKYYESWGGTMSTPFVAPSGWRQAGGLVQHTGLYKIEKGEKIVTQLEQREINNNATYQVTIYAGNRSMQEVFNEMERMGKNKLKTMVGGQ